MSDLLQRATDPESYRNTDLDIFKKSDFVKNGQIRPK